MGSALSADGMRPATPGIEDFNPVARRGVNFLSARCLWLPNARVQLQATHMKRSR